MSNTNDLVVSIENATIHQHNTAILSNINLSIKKGEFVYLVGQTGSGKSSLLKALYADIPFKEGKMEVVGYDISKIKKNDIPFLRRKLGIIFQDFELFSDRNVYENLEFVLKATGWKSSAEIKTRISEILMRVGLSSAGDKMPHQLSGGEQQRIVIARALLNEPHLLIADEPTGNLDPKTSEGILKLFHSIVNSGTAVLMATHDYTLLKKFPSKVLLCDNGTIKQPTIGN